VNYSAASNREFPRSLLKNGTDVTLAVEGRIDTSTAKEFGAAVDSVLDEADTLTLDFKDLDYISSAGLRVVLSAYKVMVRKGGLKVKNLQDLVRDVFEATGFAETMDIE
jgi:anti-sigma B factor antagonist